MPGIAGAIGKVGPSLANFPDRVTIAGRLANTPDNLVFWIQHPQQVSPGTLMPELNVDEEEARNIAAFLHSLK